MKKIIIALALISSSPAFSEMTPADSLKQAPEMVCTGHQNQDECKAVVKAVMFGTYSFTALDEQCESSSDAVKAKMDAEMKEQCAMAKEATQYLKTLRR
ncbi:TPA: hypothetical protein R4X90_000617 [Enterobacter hormaechei subsp. xiangfangensis]|uniref:Uncharacterized protein n=1 Tax=Enterobacter hormaechei TaxID=158836 RepID=A0AAE8X0L8_9ENTR|nr:hypothetical protein [Enterobacter hormaechei]AVO84267.1 hypothetical protein AM472_18305 [Enterobacter cloacae complex sp.]EIM35926.1 hypothetical protein PGS1_11826 [Enterobacter cloacae subsp. cloacae GS1]AJB82310.1 hypothetical protein LI66_13465 [Enterobacter hormaechei subsp. xiangfangensis]EJM0971485.1 hypothetical protein [Enterobacter hormaechei]EKA2117811.1 hypothetical protein [Enterobacter hormaechei]